MAKPSKISLKASLSSHQSRLQAKQKAAHAAHVAEARAKKAATGHQKSKTHNKGKARAQPPRCTLPFTPRDRILLIGEGNFSFARSLIVDPPSPLLDLSASNITATTLDSEEDCYAKYPDSKLIVSLLKSKGVDVHFEVDATKLEKTAALRGRRWDRVVWNFPHAGDFFPPNPSLMLNLTLPRGKGITDHDRNIHHNQTVIMGFLRSVAPFLSVGAVPNVNLPRQRKPKDEDEEEDTKSDDAEGRPKPQRGTVLITLRNVVPYTLWYIAFLSHGS